jgi:hypothetical protein
MTLNPEVVAARAAEVAKAARGGAAWLETNGEALSLDRGTAEYAFRRFARRAQRLRVAAGRPPCVAMFGASQAGKSYLVSSIATSSGKPLMVTYGDQRLHFLRDLNPQGEKESTGLVSRFTLRPVASPVGAPVPLRLLSQTDVVKILANAFMEDFKLDDLRLPDGPAIAALFDELAKVAGPSPQGGMTIDDVEEMREYFDLHFRTHPVIKEIGSAYWARAAEVIPHLPPSRRAEAYAPLWNGTASFTRVAADLIGALESLGFPDIAFCGLEALMPREQGVLNADTVFAIGEQSGHGAVRVVSSTGAAAVLDLALLAALIAEITVPMEQRPWDFFEQIDLIDFPGARSREVIRSVDTFLSEPGRLGRVFLRGKVAYLFQRYNTEQEIAAMLLCVGPSNQDVQTLPEMIATWIDQTIGPSPAARAHQRNSLFLMLTKFDMEFIEKEGEDITSGQRWTTRLQASLLDFFGKAYEWPRNWANGRAFDNCFWLRSTAVQFNAVFDYTEREDGGHVETRALRAEQFLAPRLTAYLQNDSIRAHFAEPERAWNEGLRDNDGGISYLAERLRPVCDPALKAEQITGRLAELAGDIAKQLRPHYHTGDLAAELERTRAAARVLVRALLACVQVQMFGPLLRALQVTQDQVTSVYWRMQSEPDDTPVPIGTVSNATDYGELGDLLDDPAPTAAALPARHRFDRLADLAIGDWTQGMQSFAEGHDVERTFHIPREQALVLVGEIARAARRLDLRETIAQELHARASFQQRSAAAAQKPVIIIEQAINSFVHVLGYDRLPPDKRPKTPNGNRTIFASRSLVSGLPPLGAQPAPYDRTFHVDWMTAIAHVMEENVQDVGSGTIDIAQNAALGKILQRLESAMA